MTPIAPSAQEIKLRRACSRQRGICARLDYLTHGSPRPNPVVTRRVLRTLLADATAVQFALSDALDQTLDQANSTSRSTYSAAIRHKGMRHDQ